MNPFEYIETLMRERFAAYPPILKIPQVAAALMEEVPTIRARIRRKTFQVTVRQENGNPQYVLLADLVRFLVTGEVQPQPDMRPARKPRNPHGLNGKRRRGRPHKVEQLKTQQVGGRP